jgi:hypothetical protein
MLEYSFIEAFQLPPVNSSPPPPPKFKIVSLATCFQTPGSVFFTDQVSCPENKTGRNPILQFYLGDWKTCYSELAFKLKQR